MFFAFFYTAIVFNPNETADNLKKYGGFIPGIRPGERTAEYIDYVLTRITVIGAVYLAFVCLLPEILISYAAVPFYFGGTSLLIVVSVTMDTVAQIQSHLLAQQYEGLIKKPSCAEGADEFRSWRAASPSRCGALLVCRIGSHIPLPGIDPRRLGRRSSARARGGCSAWPARCAGGALARLSIFSLGGRAVRVGRDPAAGGELCSCPACARLRDGGESAGGAASIATRIVAHGAGGGVQSYGIARRTAAGDATWCPSRAPVHR